MTYKKQLHPWSIVRSLDDGQKISVGRFRRYNDANSHLHFLSQMMPTLDHEIVFDPMDRLHSDCEEIGAEPKSEPVGDRNQHPQADPTTSQTQVLATELLTAKSKSKSKSEPEPALAPSKSSKKQRRSPSSLRLVE